MEKWVSKCLTCILRDKNFNESGFNLPLILFAPLVHAFDFQCPLPLFINNPSVSSPFCTFISLYLLYGNVLCMIQTLIYINSCITVKVRRRHHDDLNH